MAAFSRGTSWFAFDLSASRFPLREDLVGDGSGTSVLVDHDGVDLSLKHPILATVDLLLKGKLAAGKVQELGFDPEFVVQEDWPQVAGFECRDHGPFLPVLESLERDPLLLEELPARMLEVADIYGVIHVAEPVEFVASHMQVADPGFLRRG